MVRINTKTESGMATVLANPARMIERHGLRQRDLAPELGGESVVSEVLSGKRRLNMAHIEQLSRRFRVSPAVFFPS